MRLDRARLVGDRVAGALQRVGSMPRRNICGVCASQTASRGSVVSDPPGRSRASACRPPACASRPPTGVVARRRRSGASIHVGAHQAARGVVHQHPVVGARRRACSSSAEARRPRSAARVAPPQRATAKRLPAGRSTRRSNSSSPGATPPARACSRATRGERRQRVRDHRRGRRSRRTASAPARRRGCRVPAQGTSAKQRRAGGVGVGIGWASAGPASIIGGRSVHIAPFRRSALCISAPSCTSPTSPPASASRCPARPARPMPCCSPASRRTRAAPPRRDDRDLHRRRRPTRSAWSTRSPSSRRSCASPSSPTGRRCPTTPSRRTRT